MQDTIKKTRTKCNLKLAKVPMKTKIYSLDYFFKKKKTIQFRFLNGEIKTLVPILV